MGKVDIIFDNKCLIMGGFVFVGWFWWLDVGILLVLNNLWGWVIYYCMGIMRGISNC